jgi:CRISPR-associated protein Csm1
LDGGLAFRRAWEARSHRFITQCNAVVGSVPQVLEQVIAIVDREFAGFGMKVTAKGPVVSLPVYLRMQVAWKLAAREQRARLVYGDFSGIQAYVFASSRVGVSGLAKTLRARSARIGLMSLGIPWLKSVEVTETGLLVLSAVGGGFSVLLPPTESLESLQAETNAWLYQATHAQIVLHTAEREVTAQEFFDDYAGVLSQLHAQVGAAKRQPLSTYLLTEAEGGEDPWVWRTASMQSRCVRCEKYPPQNAAGLCRWCQLDERIGGRLPRMQWLQLRGDADGLVPLGAHSSLDLTSDRPGRRSPGVRSLNDPAGTGGDPTVWMNLALPLAPEDCPHCAANQLPDPVRRGNPYTFACLATLDSPAAPRLGYLKVDVDQLGLLMTVGLSPNTQLGIDVYRVIRLNEAIDRFFTEGVRQLMHNTHSLYTVFSGGDDLYVIGGAQHIAQFALTLNERFHAYTGFHPDVTLSAGMIFVEPHLSISLATEAVERALYRAKNVPSTNRVASGQKLGRNQITIGTTSVGWGRYRRLWEEAHRVARLLQHEWLSASGLHRLLQSAQYALQRPQAEGMASWFPRVTYEIRRNFMAEDQQPVRDWLTPYLQPDDPDLGARLALFPLLVSLARMIRVPGRVENVSGR